MAIAASQDDGTNVKEREHAAAYMFGLMSVHKTPQKMCTFYAVFNISKHDFQKIFNHDIEYSHRKGVVLTYRWRHYGDVIRVPRRQ